MITHRFLSCKNIPKYVRYSSVNIVSKYIEIIKISPCSDFS